MHKQTVELGLMSCSNAEQPRERSGSARTPVTGAQAPGPRHHKRLVALAECLLLLAREAATAIGWWGVVRAATCKQGHMASVYNSRLDKPSKPARQTQRCAMATSRVL